jgi:cholesterol oxidase
MLPILTMGYDVAGGLLRLDGDSLKLDWNPADSSEYFAAAEGTSAGVAKELGGALGPRLLRGRARARTRGITVHPLGGCPMGRRVEEGVVDPHGEVFRCPGLFVADGSIMPGPVGPNPSLTIAALAHRIAQAASKWF